jgi:hypothetical protein
VAGAARIVMPALIARADLLAHESRPAGTEEPADHH